MLMDMIAIRPEQSGDIAAIRRIPDEVFMVLILDPSAISVVARER
jgi:predicted N-acetyltransferase YhbS